MEHVYTVGGSVKWCSHYRRKKMTTPQKMKKGLPRDPAIPLLDMYPKESKAGPPRGICRPMFVAAFFMIAKLQKISIDIFYDISRSDISNCYIQLRYP